jgi:hypothetical protein
MEGPTGFEPAPQGFAVPRINHFATAPLDWLAIVDSNHDIDFQRVASYR